MHSVRWHKPTGVRPLSLFLSLTQDDFGLNPYANILLVREVNSVQRLWYDSQATEGAALTVRKIPQGQWEGQKEEK